MAETQPIAQPTPSERAGWKKEITPADQDVLGLRPVTEGGILYCGVEFQEYAIGNVTYAWPASIRKLKWSLSFSRLGQLSDMDFKDVATVWFSEFEAAQGQLTFEYTSNPRLANILYTVQRLDGKSGVLAIADIVMPTATPDTQLIVKFDDAEGYTTSSTPGQGEIGIKPVGEHETEHTLGLGHQPANIRERALIQPVYDPLITTLQAADIRELQRRYGKPSVATPPPATPPISGNTFSFGRGTELVAVTVDYPSEQSVAVKIDITKANKRVQFSGSKQW